MIRSVLFFVLVGVLLGGCSRTIGWRDYAGDVATATANGFATGGPVGGLVGLATGLITSAFRTRPVRRQIERRERLLQVYQQRHGYLDTDDYHQATGKPPRITHKKEPRHA